MRSENKQLVETAGTRATKWRPQGERDGSATSTTAATDSQPPAAGRTGTYLCMHYSIR